LDFLGFHFFVRNEAFSMGYRDPLGIKSFSWLSLPIKAIASGVIGLHRRPKSRATILSARCPGIVHDQGSVAWLLLFQKKKHEKIVTGTRFVRFR
jgi:hypothetical protein